MHRRSVGLRLLQRPGAMQVQLGANPRRERVVERLAEQVVREPVRSSRARWRRQHPRADRFVQPLGQHIDLDTGDPSQHVAVRLLTGDRRHCQDRYACLRQPGQPLRHRLPNPVGNATHGGGTASKAAPADQKLRHLPDEERVPAGTAQHIRGQTWMRTHPGHRPHQPLHVHRRQPGQRDYLAVAAGLRQQPPALVVGADLLVAERPRNHQRRGHHLARQEVQQQQRRHIRPLQIVEDYEQRTSPSRPNQQRSHRVEQHETFSPAVAQHRRLASRFRHDPGNVRGIRPEHRMVPVPGLVAPKDLNPRPVRRGAVTVPARCPQHSHATPGRVTGDLGSKRGLADSGLAHD